MADHAKAHAEQLRGVADDLKAENQKMSGDEERVIDYAKEYSVWKAPAWSVPSNFPDLQTLKAYCHGLASKRLLSSKEFFVETEQCLVKQDNEDEMPAIVPCEKNDSRQYFFVALGDLKDWSFHRGILQFIDGETCLRFAAGTEIRSPLARWNQCGEDQRISGNSAEQTEIMFLSSIWGAGRICTPPGFGGPGMCLQPNANNNGTRMRQIWEEGWEKESRFGLRSTHFVKVLLKHKETDMCLTLVGQTELKLRSCVGGVRQQFFIGGLKGQNIFSFYRPSSCLSSNEETPHPYLSTETCSVQGDNGLWKFTANGEIQNRRSEKCISQSCKLDDDTCITTATLSSSYYYVFQNNATSYR